MKFNRTGGRSRYVTLTVTFRKWMLRTDVFLAQFIDNQTSKYKNIHEASRPSNAEVKERVELYLYSPSGPSWPVPGRVLSLPFIQETRTRVTLTESLKADRS